MLGKTHLAVGVAATLAVVKPTSLRELVLAAGVGAVGALISDIDVGTSESHQDADVVTALTVGVVAVVLGLDHFFNMGIVSRIRASEGTFRLVLGLLLFIGICAYGKEQPHRSFMHSFFALALLEGAIFFIYPPLMLYFGVGFLSHLATDIWNRRDLKLLYPLPFGISFGLFSAKGPANRLFFLAGSAISIVEIGFFTLNMLR